MYMLIKCFTKEKSLNQKPDLEVLKQKSCRFNENLIDPPASIVSMGKFIYPQLGIEKTKDYAIKRWEDNLNLILMNLYIAYIRNLNLSVCRGALYYPLDNITIENSKFFSVIKLNDLFDKLENRGFIKIYKGFKNLKYDIGYATKVKLLPLLTQYFDSIKNIDFKLGTNIKKSVIITRESNVVEKSLIDLRKKSKNQTMGKSVKNLEVIKELENDLNLLNDLYKKSYITLNIPIEEIAKESQEVLDIIFKQYLLINSLELLKDTYITSLLNNLSNNSNNFSKVGIYTNSLYIYISIYLHTECLSRKISTSNYYKKLLNCDLNFVIHQKYLRRVFKESYVRGGRFYGAVYQHFNKRLRKFIRIDGEETVELDYSAMHLRMLYHSLKIDYKEDPYATPSGKGREYFKKIALITINSSNRTECIHAIKKELIGMGRNIDLKGAEKLLDVFMSMHPKISKYFYSGKWAQLQFADSTIMHNILKSLTELNIVGLPIHDSIIVQKRHRYIVKQLMIEKYKKQFHGFVPVI